MPIHNKNSLSRYLTLLAVFICCGIATLLSCNKFEFSPYQTVNSKRPSNLNAKNIAQLLSTESTSDDTVTILLTGDTQRSYEQLNELVAIVNKYSNVDFLFVNGDISNYGLLQEFLWTYERLEKLDIPYICVIGNHDLVLRGPVIFTEMFGPKNFTFTFKNYKFLCHDNNSREYDFPGTVPDLHWLSNELNDSSAKWFVSISHIPPWNTDFDQTMVQEYMNLLGSKPGCILSLHGHLNYSDAKYLNDDHVLYINSSGVNFDECYLLKLINGTVIKQLIKQ